MVGAARFLMLLTTATPSPLLLRRRRCPSLLRLARLRHRPPLSSLSNSHLRHLASSSSVSPSKINASPNVDGAFPSSSSSSFSQPPPSVHQPWAEWSNFIHNLSAAGYLRSQFVQIDEFVSVADYPEEFLRAAAASLAFARDRPQLIERLPRRDIEVVVETATSFLFKNGEDSVRRMRLFLGSDNGGVLNSDSEHMVDLMRILLSYASDIFSSVGKNIHNREVVESSVRNLLNELAQLSYNAHESKLSGSVQNQFSDRYERTPRPITQSIEMKRGDWICPRCSFMNFARNMKCLECEEARPKRELSGGEWECPQCDFFNYGRNTVCLRCDCKRPGEVARYNNLSGSGSGYGGGNFPNKSDVDRRLAENEEKAQRWFSKISQMDSTSDMSGAIADEDFPEIMPLRKGVNRFVVSTRKTPLERRLANAQYRRNSGDEGAPRGNGLQSPGVNKNLIHAASRSLDEILGHKSAATESDNKASLNERNAGADNTVSRSVSQQYGAPQGSKSNYVPFVPLPADMFAKKPEDVKMDESKKVETDSCEPLASTIGQQTSAVSEKNEYNKPGESGQPSEKLVDETKYNDKDSEQAEQSERWLKRVAELHNVADLASGISDEEFPAKMPMRKGENRFVVSKKKDRSLTSPMYKRRMAMEQANNTNFVPFVPFPPNYFAKKDNEQSDQSDLRNEVVEETSNSATQEKPPEKHDVGARIPEVATMQNQPHDTGSWNSTRSGNNFNEIKTGASSGNSTRNFVDPQVGKINNQNSGYSWNENISGKPNQLGNLQQSSANALASSKDERSGGHLQTENFKETVNSTSTAAQPLENRDVKDGWSGKSLEGSLVKEEPDPLDMSEEAKAERWFRRVAQIKDISELSQIPDEDFPSIMPMRKGVNRFVVSKRKTPLERRLTSTQYRRNLPIVRSDPVQESDNN